MNESNFLLWIHKVEGVVIANKLHMFVVNPSIPPKFASEADRRINNFSDEYECWIVQDQMIMDSWFFYLKMITNIHKHLRSIIKGTQMTIIMDHHYLKKLVLHYSFFFLRFDKYGRNIRN